MRRNDLDYSRAIAILLILIGHSNGMADLAVKIIYSFHVPLFFIISGILLKYNSTVSQDWLAFGKGRLIRIIIPSIIWEIVLSIFYFFIKGISAKELLMNSISFNFNLSVLWFIPCMLIAEISILGLFKAYRMIAKREESLVVCCTTILCFAVAGVFVNVLFVKRVLIAASFMVFGYVFEKFKENKKTDRIISHWSVCSVSFCIWIISAVINIKPDLCAGVFGSYTFYFASSIFGSFAVIIAFGYIKKRLSFLLWIGRNTFGFLVTHAFVRFFVISVGEKLFSVSVEGVLLATLMILVDVAVVWCIEKTVPEVIGLKRKKRIIRN